jgi:hypothetical protein
LAPERTEASARRRKAPPAEAANAPFDDGTGPAPLIFEACASTYRTEGLSFVSVLENHRLEVGVGGAACGRYDVIAVGHQAAATER